MNLISAFPFSTFRLSPRLTQWFSVSLALATICGSAHPVSAEAIAIPVPAPETAEALSAGVDLKLNTQQRQAMEAIGDFAIDQLEAMISSGFDPRKLERTETNKKADGLRQSFSSLFRLDDQQKESLQTILRTARDQMRREMKR